jgi:DNA-binding CsgD family transcriptional regulator
MARVTTAVDGGRLALVVGPPGVGKTTVVAAALAGRPVRWGGALASLVWRPWVPLARALGSRPPAVSPTEVAAWVAARLAPDETLVVDDAQFADGPTLSTLVALASLVPVVVVVRTGEPASGDVVTRLAAVRGAVIIPVEPLNTGDAVELLERLGVDAERAAELATHTGGLPLWCEVAAAGVVSSSLTASVAAQLARLDVAARTVVAFLGLAGRAVHRAVLGEGVAGAVAAGLVTALADETVVCVHPVVGEVAAARLTAEDRSALHRAVGMRLADRGEAARHLLAAGDRGAAAQAAREALTEVRSLTERAAVCGLIAAATERTDDLLTAAEAWLASGDVTEAERYAAAAWHRDPDSPRVRAIGSAAARRRGDVAQARQRLGAGVDAEGPDRDLLHAEALLLGVPIEGVVPGAPAHPALALARAVTALSPGSVGWLAAVEAAGECARAAQSYGVELEARWVTVIGLTSVGRLGDASTAATAGVAAAGDVGAAGWAEVFGRERARLDALAGTTTWDAVAGVATARAAGVAWRARRGEAAFGLTPREVEVLRLVGAGLSSRVIARRLGVSIATVETHVRSSVAKLGAPNRRAAAARLT